MTLKIVSFDPSLRNWGQAAATYSDGVLKIIETNIIKTSNTKSKSVKQNASDILSASVLYTGLLKSVRWADVICIEVPHGSQSSRAMVSYGICVALIGVISTINPNIVQVSANDVKAIVQTDRSHKPSKQDVISWVKAHHPEAKLPNSLSAEHICDAIVAIHAAMPKPEFKNYL